MKLRFALTYLAPAMIILLASCGKDDPKKKTEEQIQLEKLVSVWVLESAVNDGDDRTDEFNGFTLTVSGTYVEGGTYNYSVTGTRPDPSPWPASGTWKFGANKNSEIVRDPGGNSEIAVDYQVTETQLTLSFEVPDGGGWSGSGRVSSVSGGWVFTFSAQ